MAHDQWMTDGDCAFVDMKIGSTNAAVGHADKNLIVSERGPLDFGEAQLPGPSQDHGFHESRFRQSEANPFAKPGVNQ
jgi:hypothetical protein